MNEQTSHPCDELLRQWQMKRETANFYFTALLRLSPDASDALRRRQELNEKVIESLLVWKQVDDQLQSCYQEHGQRS
jgi:ribosomal protein S6